ncbi:MAG: hypothetical protein V4542_04280 [Pseudomonadota bacterium]
MLALTAFGFTNLHRWLRQAEMHQQGAKISEEGIKKAKKTTGLACAKPVVCKNQSRLTSGLAAHPRGDQRRANYPENTQETLD